MTVFDKINLANCARIRARQAVADLGNPEWERLYHGEFTTAVSWFQHRCVTTESYHFTYPAR
jgi:hypothetical protein